MFERHTNTPEPDRQQVSCLWIALSTAERPAQLPTTGSYEHACTAVHAQSAQIRSQFLKLPVPFAYLLACMMAAV